MKTYKLDYEVIITKRIKVEVDAESVSEVESLGFTKLVDQFKESFPDNSAQLNIKYLGVKSELEK